MYLARRVYLTVFIYSGHCGAVRMAMVRALFHQVQKKVLILTVYLLVCMYDCLFTDYYVGCEAIFSF